MKDIKVVKGRFHIARLIEQGEHECQDFKHSVSDAAKIAHSISAFANNKGGRLLIGVKDNGAIAGVRNEEDIYVVEQAASLYCRPEQKVDFRAYNADNGAVVIVAEVAKADNRPVLARETDGRWRAYYRVADENIVAHPLMVQTWRRVCDPDGRPSEIGETHRLLLEALGRAGGECSVEVAARGAMLSMASASAAIVDLASASLIEFVYSGQEFKIKIAEIQ